MIINTKERVNIFETIYQLFAYLILFLFFSYNQGIIVKFKVSSLFSITNFAFFCNYALAGCIINYWILPRFYYKKKWLLFFTSTLGVITLIIIIDELVLEQIFFPNTRGTYFPGITFTLIETLPLITLMVGFKIAWDIAVKQREVEELKSSVKESELQFLKSQINPHFLFNNLNNLYSYAIEESPKTPSIILELSSVLRYMLYDCKENYVKLSKELEHLKNYTQLYRLQIEERGEVNYNSKIEDLNFKIAPLILVVFIENAFKHSTSSKSDGIEIDISINVDSNGLLTFSCINNYSNVKNDDLGTTKGIGLKNVVKRLNLLYPEKCHKLGIETTLQYYKVILTMQLQ